MTTIITKNGSGAPTAGQLTTGELAVDLTNKELYTKDSGGNVIKVGAQGGSTGTFTDLTATSSFTSPGIDDNATSTAIKIDANDNVWIGSAPAGTNRQLVVQGDTDTRIDVRCLADTNLGAIDFSDTSNTARGQIVYDHSDDSMDFATLSATRMRIDASGNVGIGTSNPSEALTVNGTGYFFNSAAEVRLAPDNAIGLDFGASYASIPAAQNHGYVATGSAGAGGANGDLLIAPRTSAATSIRFITGTSPTERMRIDSSGNVGIGTSAPLNKLVVSEGTGQHGIEFSPGTTSYMQAYDRATSDYGDLKIDAQTIAFGTDNGSERMRIDALGNVGIGGSAYFNFLTNSSGNLQLTGGLISDPGAGIPFEIANYRTSDIVFSTGGNAEKMRIDASGNVGIGTSNPSNPLNVIATNTNVLVEGTGVSSTGVAFETNNTTRASIGVAANSTALSFFSDAGSTETMRIDSSGNLLVGTTIAPGNGQAVAGAILTKNPTNVGQLRLGKTASGTYTMLANYHNGVFVGGLNVSDTTTAIVASSDERLKDNIVDAPAGNIEDIKVRSFDWKSTGEHQEYGVVAQELNEVAPYAVHHNAEEDHWGVDYASLVPMLVKEIQDLKAEVAALKGA